MSIRTVLEWILDRITKAPGPKNPLHANLIFDGMAFTAYGALVQYQQFPDVTIAVFLLVDVILLALVCLAISALL